MTTNLTDMQPGRALDKLVAEALGWKDFWQLYGNDLLMFGVPPGGEVGDSRLPVPRYSQYMVSAWPVFVNGLECWGWASINADMENDSGNSMTVTIGDWTVMGKPEWAICIAYLLQHRNGYKESDDAD